MAKGPNVNQAQKYQFTMERAEQLIEKLRYQMASGAGRDQLLVTLQLLYGEIAGMPKGLQSDLPGSKVSVIVHGMGVFQQPLSAARPPHDAKDRVVAVLEVDDQEMEEEMLSIREAAEFRSELSLHARPSPELHLPEEPSLERPALQPEPMQILERDALREVNQAMGTEGTSLNDALKNDGAELGERLHHEPVKDLRKAIGINDRYLYINELFKGDQSVFDRTLKTLNDFTSLAEAKFWMERELLLKSGWNRDDKIVRQFTQLVSRRFS
jgi:hypothetical protein